MQTGKLEIEVDYDDDGNPTDVRVSGKGSGNGQLCAAAALISAAAESAGVTLRSGVYLMAKMVDWDWLEDALVDFAMGEGE